MTPSLHHSVLLLKLFLFWFFSSVSWGYGHGTQIEFNFQESVFNPLVMHIAFNFSDYLASVGGLISLIAGISVISLIEIFYHFAAYLISLRTSKRLFVKVHPADQERNKTNVINQDHVLYQCSKYLFAFIKTSSIHGLVYTTKKAEKLVGRCFWTVIVFVSAITCSYQIMETLKHAEMNPVTYEIDEKVWKVDEVENKFKMFILLFYKILSQIEFPAITYCPDADMTKLRNIDKCYNEKNCKYLQEL
jgi:Amiloride-sensitive sodium channel